MTDDVQQPAASFGSGLVDKWNSFFDKVDKDPNLQQALIQFGSGMLNSDRNQGFMGAVSNSFADAQQGLMLRRQQAAQAKLAEQQRQRDLESQDVDDDLKKAQAEKARRAPQKPAGSESDMMRAARALAATDPKYAGENGYEKAFADLYTMKKDRPQTYLDFVTPIIQEGAAIGIEPDVQKLGTTYDAIQEEQAKRDARARGELPPVTKQDILKLYPTATPDQINAVLRNPAAVEEVRARLASP